MSTREERAEATRAQLLASARELFAVRGYAGVGTEDVVRAAGLTRGALYHHFPDKRELFAAVHEQLEKELMAKVASSLAGFNDPLEMLAAGVGRFLDICLEPAVLRIAILEAPTVLGWERWREIDAKHSLGLVTAALEAAMAAGQITRQDTGLLGHLLLAACGEAAQLIAHAPEPAQARAHVEPVLLSLLAGLRVTGGATTSAPLPED
jgi:AcrR family transcriptional regulator